MHDAPECLSDPEFVDYAYRRFLGRMPDEAGRAGYLAQLRLGMSRWDLVAALVSSEEYRGVLERHLALASRVEAERQAAARQFRSALEQARRQSVHRSWRRPLPTPASSAPRLPWFMALNEEAWDAEGYGRMARAAVLSAQALAPSLQPHLLYDGHPGPLTDWMEAKGVRVIFCRSRLYEDLSLLAEKTHNESVRRVGAGAFLRAELPRLYAEGLLPSPRALYTDCDVLFRGDVPELATRADAAPFAVGPEGRPLVGSEMNTGIMVMNLPEMAREDAAFLAHCRSHLAELPAISWDQGAYQSYYGGRWEWLEPRYNWKPHWGADEGQASIVHFHGPKPTRLDSLERQEHPASIQSLAQGAFFDWVVAWEAWDALASSAP